jgi:hypothetical protein
MIAVLGRGSSLFRYKEYHSMFDKIYIVNNFNSEIDILGYQCFRGKEVIHVVGRGPVQLTSNNYKRLNVSYVQFNRLNIKYLDSKNIPVEIKPLPDYILARGFPPIPWNIYIYKLKISFVDVEKCAHMSKKNMKMKYLLI